MKARVLVVEDHSNYERLLNAAAQARGFQTLEPAISANAAIESCSKHRPEVIVLDLHLPGEVDGLSLIQLLCDVHPGVRIVASSTFADPAMVEEAFRAGAHRCLRKPFRMEECLRLFDHLAVELEEVAV